MSPHRPWVRAALAALCLWVACCSAERSDRPQRAAARQKRVAQRQLPPYLEFTTGQAKPDDPLPLVVFIHGLGGSPELLQPLLADFPEPARVILPRGPQPYRGGFAWFEPCWDREWDRLAPSVVTRAEQLAGFLTRLSAKRPTRGRPLLAGFSQGGVLAYAMALLHPEAIALAVPMSGTLPRSLWPADDARGGAGFPPIRAMHGQDDARVSISDSERVVRYLQRRGFDAVLYPFPNAGHDIYREMIEKLYSLFGEAIAAQRADKQ